MHDGAQLDAVNMAGQRPAYAVRPPMLGWHVVFRVDEAIQPHQPDEAAERTEIWAKLLEPINAYIDELHAAFGPRTCRRFRVLKTDGQAMRIGPVELVQASETLICELQAPSAQLPRVRLRVDVHSEIATFTHLVDRIPPTSDLGKRIARLSPADIDYFYDDYWREAFLPTTAHRGQTEILDALKTSCLGQPYAEFRSLGIGLRAPKDFPEPGTEPFGSEPRRPPALSPAIQGFLDEHQTFVRRLVTSADQTGAYLGAATTEAVVCGMLDGNALYASSLADRPGIVRYMIAYDGANASQLGRFIRRLHTLGELRLSALIDLNQDQRNNRESSIRRVGQKIRRLGKLVDQALMSKATTADEIGDLACKHTEASQTLRSDIIYRVERSRYYSSALEKRIEDLRIVRVEGWQPYDAFVRRYHSQDHDFIAGVGRRYRSLGQRIDRLMFLTQARRSEEYQQQLGKAVAEIRSLQVRAEDIALLAGGYYASYALFNATDNHMMKVAGGVFVGVMLFDMLLFERRIRGVLSGFIKVLSDLITLVLKLLSRLFGKLVQLLLRTLKGGTKEGS